MALMGLLHVFLKHLVKFLNVHIQETPLCTTQKHPWCRQEQEHHTWGHGAQQ